MVKKAALLCAGLIIFTHPLMAAKNTPPVFQKLRFNEDYSYLGRKKTPLSIYERLKFIPINDSKETFLSLSGEMRQRYSYTKNPLFGENPQDKKGVWLGRFTLGGDLKIGPRLRLFGQLYSALQAGRKDGPSPVDEDKLEWQNAFFDFNSSFTETTTLTFRGGRQEIQLGSGRLVDVREGPNVRRTFDGGRLILSVPDWRIDAVVARPRQNLSGAFDNKPNRDQSLWGVYASGGERILPTGKMDLYYLGFRNDTATYQQGTAKERRQSLGARWWGKANNWDFNGEAIYQFGKFGNGNISAWTLASITGYTLPDIPMRPRLAISLNIASGDENPDDDDIGSFNALFPHGNYFSQAAVLGPRNFVNIRPFVTLNATPKWSVTTDVNFFWRLQSEDGVYAPNGQLIRASSGRNEKFVGAALSVSSDWELSRNLDASAVYSLFNPGAFIKKTGSNNPINFFEVTLKARF